MNIRKSGATIAMQLAVVTKASDPRAKEKGVVVSGPFGTKQASLSQPSEVGLAVIEVLTGDMVSPPVAYRKDV